ncbi:MAG: lytic murein transglycosylase, partial [Actinomycetota bacterium]|nr:lytic murein transglycosylase [Actinomycetota bacterium]
MTSTQRAGKGRRRPVLSMLAGVVALVTGMTMAASASTVPTPSAPQAVQPADFTPMQYAEVAVRLTMQAMAAQTEAAVGAEPLETRAADQLVGASGTSRVRESVREVPAAAVAANGLPSAALRAYMTAQQVMARAASSCHLRWTLLAGIGAVESNHGRFGGAVVGRNGVSTPRIIGLPLDGSPGVAAIRDSDGGRLDGDTTWDRAVGPMQFIPTTWSAVAVDGDGDDKRDPHDLDDAAVGAGVYLCGGGGDLDRRSDLRAAVYRYNHSDSYVDLVLSYARAYQRGDVPTVGGGFSSAGDSDLLGGLSGIAPGTGPGTGPGAGYGPGHGGGNGGGNAGGTELVFGPANPPGGQGGQDGPGGPG